MRGEVAMVVEYAAMEAMVRGEEADRRRAQAVMAMADSHPPLSSRLSPQCSFLL